MYLRKLVKAGPSSHTIAIPKEWVKKHNLKKGDIVHLRDFSDKELIISANEQAQAPVITKEILIDVDNKKIDTIQREITAAYLNNYSLITLSGNSIPEKAKSIRQMVQNFVALEITEQNTKKISAKDFLNLKEISVDKTIKRMDMMIRTMFEDLAASTQSKTQLQESLELRDEDINRLYFLLVRLLKSSMVEQTIAKQLELQNKDILSYWQIVHDLENIADRIKQATEIIAKNSTAQLKQVLELYKKIQNAYENVMKAHYQKDKSAADLVAQKRIEIDECASTLISSQKKQFEIRLAENANSINTHVVNLARQVIDED